MVNRIETGYQYLLILLLSFCLSCSTDKSFNQKRWLDNNKVDDTNNPRAYMVEDVIRNYLVAGMSKDSVVDLLGPPYKDGIEMRLSRGISIPDSLSVDQINAFTKRNGQPDTLILYPVGWSTMDPNFLVVKFDGTGKVNDFWVEQH